MKFFNLVFLSVIGAASILPTAQAGVIIGGTRIIYDAVAKDASISVNNPDATPYLIQTWIDGADNSGRAAPFIVTPPLYRLNSGQQSTMRIVYTGAALPENQESLFMFNVKSIPSATKKVNTLQVAVKARMKLIYRPKLLKNKTPDEFAEKLVWNVKSGSINVTNPTPFYMNFGEVFVGAIKAKNITYVAPNATATFALPKNIATGSVKFKLINDYGGLTQEFHSN
jgi:P pilus assembly chaperone PapD